MIVAVAAAMTLSACGGGQADLSSEPVGGDDAQVATNADTDATGDGDETTATTTAEEQAEPSAGPDTTRQAYDGAGGEFVALLDDVLGQTDDVSAELGRLSPHPAFPTPTGGGYILGYNVSADTPTAETKSSGVLVDFLADAPPDDLLTLYETYYVGEGWESSERGQKEGIFGPTTELLLRKNDDPFHAVRVAVAEPELFQANLVTIHYSGFGEGLPEQVANELGDWTTEWVPTGGGLDSIRIVVNPQSSSAGLATSYSFSGTWLFPGQTDLTGDIQAAASGSGQAHETADFGVVYDGVMPGSLSVKESVNDGEELSILTTYRSDMAPSASSFGSGQNQGSAGDGESASAAAGDLVLAESANPLPAEASRDQIRAAVVAALGPTDDVSAVMADFGSFPELPTPDNAEIIGFSVDVVPTVLNDTLRAEQNRVVLRAGGASLDELVTFYESSLIGAGWIETSRNDRDNGGSTTSERTYTINGVDAGSTRDPLEIEILDWREEPEVTITWLQILPSAEVDLDRWLGWQGDLPLPPNGRPVDAGISVSDNGRRLGIAHNVTYRFEGEFGEEFEEVLIDELGPASEYVAAPFDDEATNGVQLSSDYFANGSVLIGGRSLIFSLTHVIE